MGADLLAFEHRYTSFFLPLDQLTPYWYHYNNLLRFFQLTWNRCSAKLKCDDCRMDEFHPTIWCSPRQFHVFCSAWSEPNAKWVWPSVHAEGATSTSLQHAFGPSRVAKDGSNVVRNRRYAMTWLVPWFYIVWVKCRLRGWCSFEEIRQRYKISCMIYMSRKRRSVRRQCTLCGYWWDKKTSRYIATLLNEIHGLCSSHSWTALSMRDYSWPYIRNFWKAIKVAVSWYSFGFTHKGSSYMTAAL